MEQVPKKQLISPQEAGASRTLKILMIAPTPFFADRGCHVRILEEAKALQDLGHKVTIVTYHNGRDVDGFDIRRIPRVLFWYNKLEAGPSWWQPFLDILVFLRALGVLLGERYDIVHGHLHEGALVGFAVSRLKRIPLVFDAQGSLTGELEAHKFIRQDGVLRRLLHTCETMIDHLPDAVVASTSRTVNELVDDFQVSPRKVFLVSDAATASSITPQFDASELRARLGVHEDKRVVAYLGLLNEYQGVDQLLTAVPLVCAQVPEAHFLIMGYPNVEKYLSMAETLGVESAITFTGRVDYGEATRLLSIADVAVSPKVATTEGNGKLYNYMAAGLPTVVFDSPVNREILGDCGIYVPLGDCSALAQAVAGLLMDSRSASDLGGKARERALRLADEGAQARCLEQSYAKAMQR
ncbi:MAG: glycosyltransferase family 4 protein [Chloroflexota bacterium]